MESTGTAQEAARCSDVEVCSLLEALEAAAERSGWDGPAQLVAIASTESMQRIAAEQGEALEATPEVGLVLLRERRTHPYELVHLYRAPRWALGLAVVGEGWGYPPEVGSDLARVTYPWDYADRVELRFVPCVLADGRTFWLERRRGEEAAFDEDTPETSRIVNGLRRAQGLPTGEPRSDVGELLGRIWLLDAVEAAEDAVRRGETLGWDPERMRLDVPEETFPLDPDAPEVAEVVAGGWRGLRREAEAGRLEAVHPQEARWMDEGMFARMMLERLPAAADLHASLKALLGAKVAEAAERRLAEVGWVDHPASEGAIIA